MNALASRHGFRHLCASVFIVSMLVVGGARGFTGGTDEHAAAAAPTRAEIVRAIDGDTLEVRFSNGTERGVRLIGIDTPETVRPGVPVECGGPAASSAAGRFVSHSVRLVVDPTQDRIDRYGRLLRYVVTDSGVDVGRKLIARGHAAVYVYDEPFSRLASYAQAADSARERSRGVWGGCDGDFHRPR